MTTLRRGGGLGRRDGRAGLLFAAPAYLLFLAFVLIPALVTIYLSFTYYDRLAGGPQWVGLDNYTYMFSDPRVWGIFRNTLVFTVVATSLNVGLGLLLALLLDRQMPRALLYVLRLAYFLPVLTATAFVVPIWQFLYSTDLGIINYYLRALGLDGVGWLTSERLALFSVIIMDVWKNVGFFMVILLAALQGVPRDVLEAARLDGAGPATTFWRIKLPILSPVLFFCLTFASIGALQVFDSTRLLTGGGPGDATRSVAMYMYDAAFGQQDIGSGAAVALVLMLLVASVTAFQFYAARRWVQT